MAFRQQLITRFTEQRGNPDFWIHTLLYGCLLFAFWPITQWFATTAHDQSRILHALIVLAIATVFLIRYGTVRIETPLDFNTPARNYLIASYVLLLINFAAGALVDINTPAAQQTRILELLSLSSIPAYGCAIISLALFIFGAQTRRIAVTVGWTLSSFLVLSLLMSPLDWPLRTLAGQWSGWLLSTIGQTVAMGLTQDSEGIPMLILLVNEHPFHVASECNGFGVILTSLLISILLAFYRRLSLPGFARNIATGVLLGFLFNTLRIVIIVLLAPYTMEHYMLMHEIVGGLTYWGCLIATWLLLGGPIRDETPATP